MFEQLDRFKLEEVEVLDTRAEGGDWDATLGQHFQKLCPKTIEYLKEKRVVPPQPTATSPQRA